MIASGADAYSATWTLYQLMVKFYILTFQKNDQNSNYPAGRLSCPLNNYSQHLPKYKIINNFSSQTLANGTTHSFNLSVSNTIISGWMYQDTIGQLFGSLIWIAI